MINNTRNAVSVLDRFSRDLESFFTHPDNPLAPFTRLLDENATSGLRLDLHEDESNFYARFEMPGVSKKDVSIELERDVLKVSASRFDKATGEDAEDLETRMSRSLTLPDAADVEGIAAKLADGLLTVTLPKREETKPRTIAVK